MGDHIDLEEAGLRVVPIVERADRHLAPDRRMEAGTAAPSACRRYLRWTKHPINRRRAYGEQTLTAGVIKLQPAMPLQRRQQARNHNHQPLAA